MYYSLRSLFCPTCYHSKLFSLIVCLPTVMLHRQYTRCTSQFSMIMLFSYHKTVTCYIDIIDFFSVELKFSLAGTSDIRGSHQSRYIDWPSRGTSASHPTIVDPAAERTPREWHDQEACTRENASRNLDEGAFYAGMFVRIRKRAADLWPDTRQLDVRDLLPHHQSGLA